MYQHYGILPELNIFVFVLEIYGLTQLTTWWRCTYLERLCRQVRQLVVCIDVDLTCRFPFDHHFRLTTHVRRHFLRQTTVELLLEGPTALPLPVGRAPREGRPLGFRRHNQRLFSVDRRRRLRVIRSRRLVAKQPRLATFPYPLTSLPFPVKLQLVRPVLVIALPRTPTDGCNNTSCVHAWGSLCHPNPARPHATTVGASI